MAYVSGFVEWDLSQHRYMQERDILMAINSENFLNIFRFIRARWITMNEFF